MLARMLIHVTGQLMDRIVQTSNSNSNLGNREKKETKLNLGDLGKVASKYNMHKIG